MIGEKAKNLLLLKKAGFLVPKLKVFSSEDIQRSAHDLAGDVLREFSCSRFAVRSSSGYEDMQDSSMAGQFLTKLNIPRDGLVLAIEEVCADARAKKGDLLEFAIIIQEFILPEVSGVAFTMHPQGGREMIWEFHRGIGKDVVEGNVLPTREIFYRTSSLDHVKLSCAYEMRKTFLAIENFFGFPQDIEWCIKDGQLFILQSRPVTSLGQDEYIFLKKLEDELPKSGKFFFSKNELCDGIPQPSEATFLLLKNIYKKDGPVDRSYKTFGIDYEDTDFLRLISEELYIDKEREMKSIFPAYSYFFSPAYSPMPIALRGFMRSLMHGRRLRGISVNIAKYSTRIAQLLEENLSSSSYDEAIAVFLDRYAVIAEIGLAVQASLRRLEEKLPREISLTHALSYVPNDISDEFFPPSDATGNTLALEDSAPLQISSPKVFRGDIPSNLPKKELREVQELLRLKEYGRWVAQRHLAQIRRFYKPIQQSWRYSKSFAPREITDTPRVGAKNIPLGVSSGKVTGILSYEPMPGCILVVRDLHPELFLYKDSIVGVIAKHGGILSHFSILAREVGMPVIVNYPIENLTSGRCATMCGDTGELCLHSEVTAL